MSGKSGKALDDLDQVIEDVMERGQRHRQALEMLLDEQQGKAGQLLASRALMGASPSYVTAVPLRWVAANVRFAGDLPIFKDSKADEIQRLQPDWTRQLPMATYLVTKKNHKFPPLLVVGYQNWVCNYKAEEWGVDKRAMQDSVAAEPLLLSGDYCALDTGGTSYYVLDGQHRLMAIMGLGELLSRGRLPARDKGGTERHEGGISREEILDAIRPQEGANASEETLHCNLMAIMDESVGIEIIPAVCLGESKEEARSRLKEICADVSCQSRDGGGANE